MGTIRIRSSRFSDIDVVEDRILDLPEGLIGFESHKRFALVTRGESPFMWLQSVTDPGLAFVVTDPHMFVPDYSPCLEDDALASLGASSAAEIGFLAIAVVPRDPQLTTINLQAPIAVNRGKRLARQLVTIEPRYPLKYYVFRPQGAPAAEPAGSPLGRED